VTDTQHDLYLKLLRDFYDGELKPSKHDELDSLHKLNIARVGSIVTRGREE
jgi:hypothetical protein